MDIFNEIISKMVFKRKPKINFDRVSLNTRMLKVFLELDGKKNIGEIAFEINLDMESVKKALNGLYELGLVQLISEPVFENHDCATHAHRVGTWRGAPVFLK